MYWLLLVTSTATLWNLSPVHDKKDLLEKRLRVVFYSINWWLQLLQFAQEWFFSQTKYPDMLCKLLAKVEFSLLSWKILLTHNIFILKWPIEFLKSERKYYSINPKMTPNIMIIIHSNILVKSGNKQCTATISPHIYSHKGYC